MTPRQAIVQNLEKIFRIKGTETIHTQDRGHSAEMGNFP
jgi:hypothetical protein